MVQIERKRSLLWKYTSKSSSFHCLCFPCQSLQKERGEVCKAPICGSSCGHTSPFNCLTFIRQVNILRSREFQTANNVFTGVLMQIKREGLDQSQHKTPISRGSCFSLLIVKGAQRTQEIRNSFNMHDVQRHLYWTDGQINDDAIIHVGWKHHRS